MVDIIGIIKKNIQGIKLTFMSNIIVSILSSISYLSITLSIQLIISVATGESGYTLFGVSLFAVCMLAYYAAMSIFSEVIGGRMEISIEKKIRTRTIDMLFDKSMLSVQKMHSGEIITRLTDDTRNIASFIVGVSGQLVLEIVTALLGIVYMFILSWQMAVIMVIVVPLLTIAILKLSPVFQKLAQNNLENEDGVKSFFQDVLNHLDLFKVYNMREETNSDMEKLYEKKKHSRLKLARFQGVFGFFNSFMSFGVFIITMIVGAYFAMNGKIGISKIIVIIQLANYTTIPIAGFSKWVGQAAQVKASSGRLKDIEKFNDEPNRKTLENETLERIRLSELTFAYNENAVPLNNVSIAFEKGKIIGIVGKSGIGKSTLLHLISGLYAPSGGKLMFENGLGEQFEEIGTVGYVPSDRFIFGGTIKENICMSREYSEELADTLLKEVNLYEHIKSLPQGINSTIVENGQNLSMGQAQRLAIVRALYTQAEVILFDEPTANLDAVSAQMVRETIRKYAESRIFIIVTHDQSTIDFCDVKYELFDGELREV